MAVLAIGSVGLDERPEPEKTALLNFVASEFPSGFGSMLARFAANGDW